MEFLMPISKNNSDKVFKETERKLNQVLTRAALLVERTAKQLVPVDTGTLKRSITHEIDTNKKIARVGSNVEYAAHVELGTSKRTARPYLVPALMKNRKAIKALVKLL